MMNHALETLFYPFEEGLLPYPEGRTVFFGACPHERLSVFSDPSISQHWFSDAAPLSDYPPYDDTQSYQAALCLLPKQKEEAQSMLASALRALDKGGLLIAAAANDSGGTRLEGWVQQLGLETQTLSKHKCRVVWGVKEGESEQGDLWWQAGRMQTLTFDGESYVSQPGIFGWDKVDQGSALLKENLPIDLKGRGADFGCGYGYLSRAVIQRDKVKALYAIDADRRAVDACQMNVPEATVLWADLTRPLRDLPPLDFVVMNPPFHHGKKTDIGVGQAMIRTAAHHLRRGGMLYMVANAHLPYERDLRDLFYKVDKITEEKGFKIYGALK